MEENDQVVVQDENYLSVDQIKGHVSRVKHILKEVMVKGEVVDGKVVKDGHYSKLPGCGDKLVLLKPGAEKLCLAFNLVPKYSINILPVNPSELIPPGHRDYEVTCELFSRSTGSFVGQGMGSCSTLETKYRYRNANRKCPTCNQETIFKSNKGEGWYCWAKKGGCGAKFGNGDRLIEGQKAGKVDNIDIADVYNTVKKMACKRALIHGVIQCLAVGDLFMQDVEDMKPEDFNNGNQNKKPDMQPPSSKSEKEKTAGITQAQINLVQREFGIMDKELTNEAKHTIIESAIDRAPITSIKDLTKEEGTKLIAWLKAENGEGS